MCSICSHPKHGATQCPRVTLDPKQSPANDRAREAQFGKKRGGGWDKGKKDGNNKNWKRKND